MSGTKTQLTFQDGVPGHRDLNQEGHKSKGATKRLSLISNEHYNQHKEINPIRSGIFWIFGKVVSNIPNIHLRIYKNYQNFHPLIFYGYTRLCGLGADLPLPLGEIGLIDLDILHILQILHNLHTLHNLHNLHILHISNFIQFSRRSSVS